MKITDKYLISLHRANRRVFTVHILHAILQREMPLTAVSEKKMISAKNLV